MKGCGECKHLRDDNIIDIGECIKNNYKYFEPKEPSIGNSRFKLDIGVNKKNNPSDDNGNSGEI
mgnify:CR=1 FL=1